MRRSRAGEALRDEKKCVLRGVMQARGFWILNDVADGELEANLQDLLRVGACTDASVIAHLAEVDARRLHLRGAPSLFEYCQVRLGLSESEAWYRICAARGARKFPIIFQLLERREIHLTALALIAKCLTEENHRELLRQVCGKTKRQILELLARRAPRADVKSHIRKLPPSSGAVSMGPTGALEPLSLESYRLTLNVSAALQEKLELARDLMSHANPSGDLGAVVERAVDLLIARLQARRFGQTKRAPAAVDAAACEATKFPAGKATKLPVDEATKLPVDEATKLPVDEATKSPVDKATKLPVDEATKAAADEATKLPADEATKLPMDEATKLLAGTATNAHEVEATEAPAAKVAAVAETRARKQEQAPGQGRKRRHIANDVRRQVLARDGARCSYVAPDGQRCCARAFLELDHSRPWAKGGLDDVPNLRLLCRAHNRLLAEREFGVEVVERSIARRLRAGVARRPMPAVNGVP